MRPQSAPNEPALTLARARALPHACLLARSGAPASIAHYPDAETASQVLLAAGGPVSVTYERLDIA
jgi:hypothetical protein